jgi:hypothetical protein
MEKRERRMLIFKPKRIYARPQLDMLR